MKVGWPRWSSTKRRPVVLARQAQDRLDHVAAVIAADPRGADDGRVRAELAFAGQLRAAVDRLRVGFVPLDVRRSASCRRTRSRSTRGRRARRPAGALRRHGAAPSTFTAKARSGSASQASTAVHAAEWTIASGCDAVIRPRARRRDRRRRDARAIAARSRRARRFESRDEVAAELPGGSGDEDPHDRPSPGRCRSGSHHQRLSRYHSTVASRASPRSRVGRPAEGAHLRASRSSSADRGRADPRRTRSTRRAAPSAEDAIGQLTVGDLVAAHRCCRSRRCRPCATRDRRRRSCPRRSTSRAR